MIVTKITSSLEKIFADETPETYRELKRLTALKGERVSIQYLFTYDQKGSEIKDLKKENLKLLLQLFQVLKLC